MSERGRVMDIFESQRRATLRSGLLVALWAALTAVLVVPGYVVVWLALEGWRDDAALPGLDAPLVDPFLAWVTAAAVVGAITAGSLYQWARLRKGGAEVVRLMGGRPVAAEPSYPLEQRFRNVAEEMAIAATTPTPALFVLPAEPGINAFAAGLRPEAAAIAHRWRRASAGSTRPGTAASSIRRSRPGRGPRPSPAPCAWARPRSRTSRRAYRRGAEPRLHRTRSSGA